MQKIRTALLSYGMSGKVFHAPFLNIHHGFELTGAMERSKKLIQNDFPAIKSYKSLDEIIADKIELIIVNTPVNTHFDYAKEILNAGINLVVEKPFTTTSSEAEILMNLAVEKNLKLAIFHNRRWDSDFQTVAKILDQNVLGDIIEAEIRFDRFNPSLSPKKWKESPVPGSGILMDLGSHIIDQAIYLFGYPNAVFADIRSIRENSLVDDNFDILLYYPNKRVRLHAGFFNKETLPAYTIQGRHGSLLKHRGDVQEDNLKADLIPDTENWGVEPLDKSGILHTIYDGKSNRKNIPTLQGNYYAFFDKVFDSIRHDRMEPVTAEDGLKVMKVIEAAILSNEQGRLVNLS